MTTAYETLSKEEANSFFFGGQPQMAPQQMAPQQSAPVDNAPRKTKPVLPPAMGKPVVADLDPQGLVNQVGQANKAIQAQTPAPQAPSVVGALIDQIVGNWALPALGLGALAAAGYAGYKSGAGAKEGSKEGLKSRDIMNRIDPTMETADLSKPTPTAVPVPVEKTQTKFAKDFETKYGVPLAKAEEISGGKITKQWEADIVGNAIKNNLPITVKTESPSTTSLTTKPAAMTGPIVSEPPKSQFDTSKLGQPFDVTRLGESKDPLANRGFQYPVAPTAEPAANAPTEKSTSKGPKKEPAVVTYKTAKDIPEGFVFRPDVGNLDRSLGNILGLEHRANAREMFTGGKPFGQFKGSGPTAFNDEISRLTTDYFQKLQSEIPETILSRDARRAQGIPSDFGTFATKTNFGKAAKVAGVAGTLFAAADLANAKTAEQKANAGVNLLGAVLPPGADIFEAGAPTLGEKQKKAFENAQKLGSPYRSVSPR